MQIPSTTASRILLGALVLLLIGCLPEQASAQETVPPSEPRPSPLAMAQTMLGDTYVKIVYSSPRKRGRTLFGPEGSDALETYGAVWRTGANEATEFVTTGDLNIGGKTLPAGTYSVFTIPGEDEWTLIFNSGLGQWGAFSYDEALDVMRVDVPAETIPQDYEAFTIAFEDQGGQTMLTMMWGQTKISVPVQAV